MLITLPLALLGIGLLVYLLFVAATYVVPLYAGLSAGFTALHAGTSYTAALLLGATAFLIVILVGKTATRLLPSRAATVVILLLFAAPAGIAGYQVAYALLHLSGAGDWSVAFSLMAALATRLRSSEPLPDRHGILIFGTGAGNNQP